MTKYYWWLLVAVVPVVALAQGLPGVVREGEYIQGTLGSIYQAALTMLGDSGLQRGRVADLYPWPPPTARQGPVVGYRQVRHSTTYITERAAPAGPGTRR
jgi:hypothetical protein